ERFGRIDKFDVAFLLQFAGKGIEHGLARLDAAAREMPAADIRVLDQKHPALRVDHETTNAERQPPGQTPIEMHQWARSARCGQSQLAENGMKLRHVS